MIDWRFLDNGEAIRMYVIERRRRQTPGRKAALSEEDWVAILGVCCDVDTDALRVWEVLVFGCKGHVLDADKDLVAVAPQLPEVAAFLGWTMKRVVHAMKGSKICVAERLFARRTRAA